MKLKRSWSDLPTELLQIICEKLVEIDDYARFGVVCTPWREALWLSRKKIPPQLPVLMCPNYPRENSSGTHSHTYAFFRFSSAKTDKDDYFFPFSSRDFHKYGYGLPETVDSIHPYCHGSSHGWLLTKAKNSNIQLINPFLSHNNVIKLPSLWDHKHIRKFILSDNPTWTSDYVVMVSFDFPCYKLAFLRPSDKSWTLVDREEREDLICYKDQFYAIGYSGKLVSFNVNSSELKFKTEASLRIQNQKELYKEGYGYKIYRSPSLVEVSGELLCVVGKTYHDTNKDCAQMIEIVIFKFETLKSKWIHLRTLENHALFVDNASSLCLLASDSGHCKPNHIYFIYDSDMRAFNFEEWGFESLISTKFSRTMHPGQFIWVQPTLNMINKSSCRGWSNLVCDARPNTDTLEREQNISAHDDGKETLLRHLQIQQIADDYSDSDNDFKYDLMSDEYLGAAGDYDDNEEEDEEDEGEDDE